MSTKTQPVAIPAVSVIVSNLNGARYLPRLLDTLTTQDGVDVEIVVVDRHSTDASMEILERYPAVRIAHEPPESGLVAGYDVGARESNHPLLFFCNEDLYLGEHCLRDLASRIDLDRRIAAADPWWWNYEGDRWTHGGVAFRRSPFHVYSPFPFRMYEFTLTMSDGSPIPFGCAGAVMVHASVYRELGGWDTSFFLDFEDFDFFIRAWQHDWICVTVPSAQVFHEVGASNEQQIGVHKQSVSRLRYIAHRSNVIIVAFKYFSPAVALIGVVNWMAMFMLNIALLRWRTAWLDIMVVGKITRRLPAVIAYRRRNRRWNRTKPGERYFFDQRFRLRGEIAQ
ncbi:MAG TPA: glycosyltransferase family 2 protein [Solirubrobacteraceae bacterium]|jgi:GT2 family glycosyltransferase|nr:glycosyltransferase family 2 protein [Solirubrobacteraceae bacterium]